jgi:flagellar basal-body rod modification protein FlgD
MEIFRPHTSIHSASAHPAPPAAAKAAAENDPGTSGNTDSINITANDFLSLLVAEMKNQDPTANSDPNEYINQLVQVNSLQQLIQINQKIGAGARSSAAPAVSPLEVRLREGMRSTGAAPSRTPQDPASRLATALSHQGFTDQHAPAFRRPSAAPSIHP